MAKVELRQYAGAGSPSPAPSPPTTTAYSKKVDNAKAKRFSVGSNWGTSSYSSQRYKADYRFAKPGASYSAASFKVKTPVEDDYAFYGWWPADPGYNDRTVFWICTTGGWVSKTVDQSTNGGK